MFFFFMGGVPFSRLLPGLLTVSNSTKAYTAFSFYTPIGTTSTPLHSELCARPAYFQYRTNDCLQERQDDQSVIGGNIHHTSNTWLRSANVPTTTTPSIITDLLGGRPIQFVECVLGDLAMGFKCRLQPFAKP